MAKGFIRIVLTLIGLVLGWSLSQNFFHTPSIHDQMVQSSNRINATLPKMLDSVTRFDSTSVNANHFCYHYIVLGEAAKLTPDQITAAMRPSLVDNYKTKDEMKSFRDNNVTLDYTYSDSSGKQIAQIEINAGDAK